MFYIYRYIERERDTNKQIDRLIDKEKRKAKILNYFIIWIIKKNKNYLAKNIL